ncbi:MAG: hypothetical protein M3R24_28440 [Chloroflexota bacterium]|nr:hypothetical protein [Chloroflexota bacterium]
MGLEQMVANKSLAHDLADFLKLVIGWLQGADVTEQAKQLTPDFGAAYKRIVEMVTSEQEIDDGMQQLLQQVYTLLVRGTALQRRSFADQIAHLSTQIPSDQAALHTFLNCLITALCGEDVNAIVLEEPFAAIWHDLQDAVARADASAEEE